MMARALAQASLCLAAALASMLPGQALAQAAKPGTVTTMNDGLDLDGAVRAAMADAALRTGAAVGSLRLISAERVTWPDASLGCPAPGMGYAQVLVPGWRIRVQGPAGVLAYHASNGGMPFYCPAKRVRNPVPGGSNPSI